MTPRESEHDAQIKHLCNRIEQLLATAKREGMELHRDGFGANRRAEAAEAQRAALHSTLSDVLAEYEYAAKATYSTGKYETYHQPRVKAALALLCTTSDAEPSATVRATGTLVVDEPATEDWSSGDATPPKDGQ